ncbi:hypothetical protein ADUPG1_006942 [Aduncisulcus paluster]|uniref:SP-RING-type domain-containing protein n=1 Tax=Aduncisulcus paluster TaxID=2918883 RepID=A0ABQ5KNJ9_9EUKA|nr:hypothetical protein ADUPG1_006942 [Aduncisulcus paluster]
MRICKEILSSCDSWKPYVTIVAKYARYEAAQFLDSLIRNKGKIVVERYTTPVRKVPVVRQTAPRVRQIVDNSTVALHQLPTAEQSSLRLGLANLQYKLVGNYSHAFKCSYHGGWHCNLTFSLEDIIYMESPLSHEIQTLFQIRKPDSRRLIYHILNPYRISSAYGYKGIGLAIRVGGTAYQKISPIGFTKRDPESWNAGMRVYPTDITSQIISYNLPKISRAVREIEAEIYKIANRKDLVKRRNRFIRDSKPDTGMSEVSTSFASMHKTRNEFYIRQPLSSEPLPPSSSLMSCSAAQSSPLSTLIPLLRSKKFTTPLYIELVGGPHSSTPLFGVGGFMTHTNVQDLVKEVKMRPYFYKNKSSQSTRSQVDVFLGGGQTPLASSSRGKKLGSTPSGNKKDEEDSDLEEFIINLPLTCPLLRGRCQIPAKSIQCAHPTCFDLETFISYSLSVGQWKCPCCLNGISFEDLRVDGDMMVILKNSTISQYTEIEEAPIIPNNPNIELDYDRLDAMIRKIKLQREADSKADGGSHMTSLSSSSSVSATISGSDSGDESSSDEDSWAAALEEEKKEKDDAVKEKKTVGASASGSKPQQSPTVAPTTNATILQLLLGSSNDADTTISSPQHMTAHDLDRESHGDDPYSIPFGSTGQDFGYNEGGFGGDDDFGFEWVDGEDDGEGVFSVPYGAAGAGNGTTTSSSTSASSPTSNVQSGAGTSMVTGGDKTGESSSSMPTRRRYSDRSDQGSGSWQVSEEPFDIE